MQPLQRQHSAQPLHRPPPACWCPRSSRVTARHSVVAHAASRCHYEVLGLQPHADVQEIKAAFRKKALETHPDRNPAPNATEVFKSVKKAYEVLSDPHQRAAYNRQRLQAQAQYTRSSRHTSSSAAAGSTTYHRVVYDYEREDIDDTFEEAAAAAGFWGWYQESGSWQSSWRSNRKKRKAQQEQRQQQQQQQRAQQVGKQQQGQPKSQQRAQQQQQQQQQRARQQQSWQQHREQRQQQSQQRQQRRQQLYTTAQELLSQLDAPRVAMVRHIFGANMEKLNTLEELVEVLESLELLQQQGISLDGIAPGPAPSSSRSSSSSSSSSSSRSSSKSWGVGGDRGSPRTAGGSAARRSSSAASSSSRTRSSSNGSTSRASAGARSSKGPWAGGSRQYGRRLPRFDELSAEELYELINSKADRRTARAARAWVQQMLASDRMHPGLAGSLAFLLATDYIMGDVGVEDEQDEGPLDPREWVFGQLFDPESERYRGRARVGSAGDYVRYDDSDSDSSSDDEDDGGGWVGVEELLSAFEEGWDSDDDSGW